MSHHTALVSAKQENDVTQAALEFIRDWVAENIEAGVRPEGSISRMLLAAEAKGFSGDDLILATDGNLAAAMMKADADRPLRANAASPDASPKAKSSSRAT